MFCSTTGLTNKFMSFNAIWKDMMKHKKRNLLDHPLYSNIHQLNKHDTISPTNYLPR